MNAPDDVYDSLNPRHVIGAESCAPRHAGNQQSCLEHPKSRVDDMFRYGRDGPEGLPPQEFADNQAAGDRRRVSGERFTPSRLLAVSSSSLWQGLSQQ